MIYYIIVYISKKTIIQIFSGLIIHKMENSNIIIKSQETREGVQFRVLKDDKYLFYNVKFQNYFYVKKSDYTSHEDDFIKEFKFCIADVIDVGQFAKIKLKNNWMRNKVRTFWEERCHTYEADIKANKRLLLDKELMLNNTKIPYTFFDIETDDRLPLQKDERGNVIPASRILSFSGVDHKGEVFFEILEEETPEAERKFLTSIIKYLSNYGIISGWNSEKFDMTFIKGRCDIVGVNYSITDYINHLDYMALFKKYDKKSRPSFSLNAISNEVLNESKIDQAKGNGAIYNTWLKDKEQLKRYNIEDSNLVYKINKKMMFIEVSMKRADNAKCHVRNTVNNSDSGDYLLMREYKKHNIIMPSQPTKDEVLLRKAQGKIGGGYTTCFKPGFHKDVRIWDFKSEYPSVIQSWNISPETYVETIYNDKDAALIDRTKFIVTPSDFEGVYHPSRVYKKEEGIIPKVVRSLVEERDKIKYTMKEFETSDPGKYKQLFLEQYALKTDANSIYGILAFVMSRYYSWELGDSVTTCARATLKACNVEVIKWGCSVIGGDTDSSFVLLGEGNTIDEINQLYVDFLQDWASSFGCVNNKLVFEYEKTFDKMLFVKKKHYAFKIDDKIKIKGMEAIKSDSNPLAAKLQKDFIFDVLNEEYKEEFWKNKVEDLYIKVIEGNLKPEELLLRKALTKMPKDYEGFVIAKATGKPKVKLDGTLQKKSIPAHVKLAERQLKEGIDLYPGSKIKYIVIKDKPILAISLEEYNSGSGLFPYKDKKKGEIMYSWEGSYAIKYYWTRIIKPLIKVASTYHQGLPDWEWSLSTGQMNKILKSQMKDEVEE